MNKESKEKMIHGLPYYHCRIFTMEDGGQCFDITETDVVVYGRSGHTGRGSSRVKLKNIVDYKWEKKYYSGHLIAIHKDELCIAYAIKVNTKMPEMEGMVRVISSGRRSLIKGMTEVLDLQFAHNEKHRILACAEAHALHVYKIDISENLVCNLLLTIEDTLPNYAPKYDKIAWCPFIPDDLNYDDDANQLLVWARGSCFQCLNINTILNSCGTGIRSASNLSEGYLRFFDSAIIITWVGLSPDGTTLSVGSEDGFIRFYQVYFHEKEPRCLHQWNPHNGKAISSFFFLDNLVKTSEDAYWKYALTGACKNTEFKIWDCGTWDCLQSLSLRSSETENLAFIADIDKSASYLIASSIESSVVYVVQLVNDVINASENQANPEKRANSIKQDDRLEKSCVIMKSISEFPLSAPILSFSTVDATVRKYKCQEDESILTEDLYEYDDDTNAAYCVVIRMFIVQPKSVQECHIIYQPTVPEITDVRSSISSDISLQWNTAVPIETANIFPTENFTSKFGQSINKISLDARKTDSLHKKTQLILGGKNDKTDSKASEPVDSGVLSTILMLASVTNSPQVRNTMYEDVNELSAISKTLNENSQDVEPDEILENIAENNIATRQTVYDEFRSSSSSPSLEVQEILDTKPFNLPTRDIPFLERISSKDNCPRSDFKKESNIDKNNGDEKTEFQSNTDTWSELLTSDCRSNNVAASKNSVLQNFKNTFDVLLHLAQKQSESLLELRSEVDYLKKQNMELSDSVKRIHFNAEHIFSKLAEDCFDQYEKNFTQRLENFVAARTVQNYEFKENITQLLKQFLYKQLPEKQDSLLPREIHQQIISIIEAKLNKIEEHFKSEISQRVAGTENILKSGISQLSQNKHIMEAFGNAVVLGVQTGLKSTYVQSMSTILIPAYEKSSKEMFKQLHQTFTLGIKEAMNQLQGYVNQVHPVYDEIEKNTHKIESFVKCAEDYTLQQKTIIPNHFVEIKNDLKSLETRIANMVASLIQEETRKRLEMQGSILGSSFLTVGQSHNHSPTPSLYDVQDQIKHLLQHGQYNDAFHQALLANDLALVEFVLEKADYKYVFQPCVLEQTVLLSLIQQISADFQNHSDVRQRYLSDAILNLNYADPITKEHAPRVMRELCKNCRNYLTNFPNNQYCSNVRIIMMAIQGMGFNM